MQAKIQIFNIVGTGPWTCSLGFYYGSRDDLIIGDQFIGNPANEVFEVTNNGNNSSTGGVRDNVVIIDADSHGGSPSNGTIAPLWTPIGIVKLSDAPLSEIGASQLHALRNRDNVLTGNTMTTDIYDTNTDGVADESESLVIDGQIDGGNF